MARRKSCDWLKPQPIRRWPEERDPQAVYITGEGNIMLPDTPATIAFLDRLWAEVQRQDAEDAARDQ